MLVYNSNKKDSKNNNDIFRHLGVSPIAAANRIESMFSHQHKFALNNDFTVTAYDNFSNISHEQTLEQHLANFCSHAKKFSISEYSLGVNRPLRLIDLWEDDPIGSGGPLVVEQSQISSSELKEIQEIFHPFSSVIHPKDIFSRMSKNKIKDIKPRYKNDSVFSAELNKRKKRSVAIGENFNNAQYHEIVWLDFSFKLKEWALGKGYDSFVYSNEKEGNGEDTYITLLPEQLSKTGIVFEFLEDKYLSEMPAILREVVERYRGRPLESVNHLLWGLRDPMRYWK